MKRGLARGRVCCAAHCGFLFLFSIASLAVCRRYFQREDILTALRGATRLDCKLYALGLRRFAAQVKHMERLTGIRFMPDDVATQGRYC